MSFKPKRITLMICTGIAVLILSVHTYGFIKWAIFLWHAKAYNATIAEVSYEQVQKGKVLIMAYVPIVEIPIDNAETIKIKVSTFDEQPIYHVGERLNVLCNRSVLDFCVCNTFITVWGGVIEGYLLGFAFLLPLLYYRFVYLKRQSSRKDVHGQNAA